MIFFRSSLAQSACDFRGSVTNGKISQVSARLSMNLPTSPRPKQEIGGVMPDMALPLVSGGTADLQMFLDGKKGAVVLFWSETCSHCLRYDVYLNEFTDRHPD